jgi:hypothetical protein
MVSCPASMTYQCYYLIECFQEEFDYWEPMTFKALLHVNQSRLAECKSHGDLLIAMSMYQCTWRFGYERCHAGGGWRFDMNALIYSTVSNFRCCDLCNWKSICLPNFFHVNLFVLLLPDPFYLFIRGMLYSYCSWFTSHLLWT